MRKRQLSEERHADLGTQIREFLAFAIGISPPVIKAIAAACAILGAILVLGSLML
ncbi:MAG: hypothetical protein JNK75_14375 [Betaproteobacteria bacterium]|nr:hypothetical protein [Betaproteobacteria bacterium]